ncbi:MAG: TonB-dependent receptor, partial [Gemmatimonadaceae bacterium]
NVVTRGFNNIFSGALMTLIDNRFASVPSLRVNVPYLMSTQSEDIERIEVVLGPGAALYGPNSANGVMHIITKSPFESEGTTLTVGGGERSVARGALRHAMRVNDMFAFKVSGDWMTGDDWRYIDPAEPVTTVPNFNVRRWSGDVRFDVRPTPGLEWTTSYGRATALDALELTGTSGRAQVKDWTNQTIHTRVHRGRFFAQAFQNFSNSGATTLLRTNTPIIDKSRLTVAQVQQGMSLTRKLDLTVGGDYQRTDPRTEGTINGRNENDDNITETGGYGHIVAHLTSKIDVSAAARIDNNSRLKGAVFSPRAAIVYKPTTGQSLRLTFNQAFNTPSNFNLFLDLPSGAIPFGPLGTYRVVALGVPKSGFQFRRDCAGGLCMRTPFAAIPGGAADPAAFLEADATLRWRSAVEVAIAQNPAVAFLRALPPPTKASVSTNLGVLEPTTKTFRRVNAADVIDVAPLQPTHNNALEVGYKGVIGRRLQLTLDVWHEARRNFIGPSLVETPNVFLDSASTAQYLSAFVPAANAQAIAGGLAKVPVGTIGPDHALTNAPGPDIIVTYRNYGKLNVWGSDFGGEVLVTDRLSVLGTYSYVNRDLFPRSEVGGLSDVTLNAPANKGSLTTRFRDHTAGWGGDLRARYVAAFPVESGVYKGTVATYALLDGSFDVSLPRMSNLQLTVTGTNLLNKMHREFIGVPEIGRLIMTQLRYSF